MQIYLFTVLRQQRRELVNYDSRGQSIVCWRVVDLLALPLKSTTLLVKCVGSVSEPFSACQATSIELGVVAPRGGTILSFILRLPRAILLVSVSFPNRFVSFTGQPSH
jgi:hypothetical protein